MISDFFPLIYWHMNLFVYFYLMQAEQDTDEVYAQVTLLPELKVFGCFSFSCLCVCVCGARMQGHYNGVVGCCYCVPDG